MMLFRDSILPAFCAFCIDEAVVTCEPLGPKSSLLFCCFTLACNSKVGFSQIGSSVERKYNDLSGEILDYFRR